MWRTAEAEQGVGRAFLRLLAGDGGLRPLYLRLQRLDTAAQRLDRQRVQILAAQRRQGLARPADEKARLAQPVEATLWPWVSSGAVRPPIERTFPLDQASAAHALLEGGDHVGKIVLIP